VVNNKLSESQYQRSHRGKFCGGKLTNSEIEQVCLWVKKGGKLSIGSNPTGARKVKVAHGLFGLFVDRFAAEETEIKILKQKLNASAY
jgi:hypothetical protein